MEYRKIGNSNLSLSVITFGAWAAGGWMWGRTDRREAVDAIKSSIDCGVTSIDTAAIYGQGASEEIVGEAIQSIPRDRIQILTKFGMRWDLAKGDFSLKSKDNQGRDIDIYKYAGKESVILECENSLRRLKTDYIDLYQIHWPDSTTPISETFEAVNKLIEQGKIRYAGVSNYNVAQLKEAQSCANVISNQVPFSMVNRKIEQDLLPYCIGNNTSILAYSPMERGLLTGKMKLNQVFQEGDHRSAQPYFTNENIAKINNFLMKIKPIADARKVNLNQVVLAWTFSQPGITIALAGARNAKQAISNSMSAELKLDADEMNLIKVELELLKKN